MTLAHMQKILNIPYKELLELINKFNKAVAYKINTKKTINNQNRKLRKQFRLQYLKKNKTLSSKRNRGGFPAEYLDSNRC